MYASYWRLQIRILSNTKKMIQHLEELRNYLGECLQCPVCMEFYKDPQILLCLHSICSECLHRLLRISNGTALQCPVCREDNGFQPATVIYRTDTHINLLIELYGKVKELLEKKEGNGIQHVADTKIIGNFSKEKMDISTGVTSAKKIQTNAECEDGYQILKSQKGIAFPSLNHLDTKASSDHLTFHAS